LILLINLSTLAFILGAMKAVLITVGVIVFKKIVKALCKNSVIVMNENFSIFGFNIKAVTSSPGSCSEDEFETLRAYHIIYLSYELILFSLDLKRHSFNI
jgi:hypothetical protein